MGNEHANEGVKSSRRLRPGTHLTVKKRCSVKVSRAQYISFLYMSRVLVWVSWHYSMPEDICAQTRGRRNEPLEGWNSRKLAQYTFHNNLRVASNKGVSSNNIFVS